MVWYGEEQSMKMCNVEDLFNIRWQRDVLVKMVRDDKDDGNGGHDGDG